MPDPASHLFDVRVDVEGLAGAAHVDLQMPRWSPGRYAVFDFAKNVQEARYAPYLAASATSPAERLDTQTWRVPTKISNGATVSSDGVTLMYKVFADDLSGTFSQLDARHANFNGHSVFVYVAGHKHDPVTLKVDAPKGWKIINGQSKGAGQSEFRFANYDLLADTPTEVAPDFNVETFEVAGNPRFVVHPFATKAATREQKTVRRVVLSQLAFSRARLRHTLLSTSTDARRGAHEHLKLDAISRPRRSASDTLGRRRTASHRSSTSVSER